MLALTRKTITDLFLAISNIGGVRIYLRECFLPVIRCQCFIRIFLRIGVARLKVVTNGKIFFDGLGLSCKATVRDSKRTSVRIVSARFRRQLRSVRRVKNSFFFNSNYSLIEFVLNKRKASVTAKYFLVFRISQVFPFEPFVASFALLSYSICGFSADIPAYVRFTNKEIYYPLYQLALSNVIKKLFQFYSTCHRVKIESKA